MPCLFAVFAGAFPRLGTLLLWIARPAMFTQAFGGNWFWPLLGIIFLPFTTLMFVIVVGPTGLVGWDWFWVGLAVVLDISHWGSVGYAQRDKIPGMSSSAV